MKSGPPPTSLRSATSPINGGGKGLFDILQRRGADAPRRFLCEKGYVFRKYFTRSTKVGFFQLPHSSLGMSMTYFWLTAVINITRECNAPKLERSAQSRMVITVAFIALSLAAGLMNIFGLLGSVGDTVTSIQFILQYVVIIINILFLHTCFVLITSEKQYEKDKQQLAKEQNEAIRKMQEKKAARQERLNRRNGKK